MPDQPQYEAMRRLGIGENELQTAIANGELCEYCCCPIDRCECAEPEND